MLAIFLDVTIYFRTSITKAISGWPKSVRCGNNCYLLLQLLVWGSPGPRGTSSTARSHYISLEPSANLSGTPKDKAKDKAKDKEQAPYSRWTMNLIHLRS